MTKQEQFEQWLLARAATEEAAGKPMFLKIPDEWYEQGLHCCNNGHVNGSYLKMETKGAVCFDCREPSHIFPTGITPEEFMAITKTFETEIVGK